MNRSLANYGVSICLDIESCWGFRQITTGNLQPWLAQAAEAEPRERPGIFRHGNFKARLKAGLPGRETHERQIRRARDRRLMDQLSDLSKSDRDGSLRGERTLPKVLLVGDSWRREFWPILERVSASSLAMVASNSAAAQAVLSSQENCADLVIHFHAGSGCQDLAELRRLLDRVTPLTPVVIILGSWAEGASRNALLIPGSLYLPWYQWEPFWEDFLNAFCSGKTPVTSLSPCMSMEEYFLFREGFRPAIARKGTVSAPLGPRPSATVVTPCRETWRLLADTLCTSGFYPVWERYPGGDETRLSKPPRGEVVLLDMLAEPERIRPVIQWARTGNEFRTIIVVHSFPRVCETEMLRSWGADIVLGKPIDVAHLVTILSKRKLFRQS